MNQWYWIMLWFDNYDWDYIIMRDSYKFFSNFIFKYTVFKDFLFIFDQVVQIFVVL